MTKPKNSKEQTGAVKRTPPNAGKGRVKGVPNKTTKAVKECIIEAFQKAGGVEYLVGVAKTDPKTFCALLGRIIPTEVTGKDGGALTLEALVMASKGLEGQH